MTRFQTLLALAQEELDTADLLWQNDRYRACISRSYYEMYHATQALLSLKNIQTKTHRGTIQAFGQHYIKTGELPIEMARHLSEAYDFRQLSDYEELISPSKQQAAIILQNARAFISQLSSVQ